MGMGRATARGRALAATLRRLCGWERIDGIPSEATFSRAFAECAESELPTRLHEALVRAHLEGPVVGHIARDSTAIPVRERRQQKAGQEPERAAQAAAAQPRSEPAEGKSPDRGESRPGSERERLGEREAKRAAAQPARAGPSRLERQRSMTLEEMLEDLPRQCDQGAKKNAQGYKEAWNGYQCPADVADGGIPVSCAVTSVSVHDSHVAIPLATLTAERADSLYDLLDSAFNAAAIKAHSRSLGHVPLIEVNPRRNQRLETERQRERLVQAHANYREAGALRYRERTTVERVLGRLKDEFGGRHVRVRGQGKVACHLMLSMLALTVDQLLRMAH